MLFSHFYGRNVLYHHDTIILPVVTVIMGESFPAWKGGQSIYGKVWWCAVHPLDWPKPCLSNFPHHRHDTHSTTTCMADPCSIGFFAFFGHTNRSSNRKVYHVTDTFNRALSFHSMGPIAFPQSTVHSSQTTLSTQLSRTLTSFWYHKIRQCESNGIRGYTHIFESLPARGSGLCATSVMALDQRRYVHGYIVYGPSNSIVLPLIPRQSLVIRLPLDVLMF